jgi:DNA-binding IclR family transcriptional regulator
MKHSAPLNQSAVRALSVLEYLAQAGAPQDLAVISAALGMNKSTAYRFVSTLAAQGYVRQDAENGRYALGPRVVWLASKFLERLEVRSVARPALEALARDTGETVHLAILDQDAVVYIDKIDGQASVRMASGVGCRMPLHSTSLGKALLADFPESAWRAYVSRAGLGPCTPHTIVEPAAFLRELERVRKQNYAIDDMENEEGIRCVAAPLRDHTGRAVAAVSLSGWTLSMTPERVRSLVPRLQTAIAEISQRLGYQ